MLEVIPSINCNQKDTKCVSDRCRIAAGFSAWVHLDVADAIFTFNRSWDDASQWESVAPKGISLEVHLMVEEPERHIERWLAAGAKRIIVHAEMLDNRHGRMSLAPANIAQIIKNRCKEKGAEFAIAINPETSAEVLEHYSGIAERFLILAVHPGPSGQRFLSPVLEKVRYMKFRFPSCVVQVDGGIDDATARECVKAGASSVVSGSFLFSDTDPPARYRDLQKASL